MIDKKMKIAIDISEDDYYDILQYVELKTNTEFENLMIAAIKNGTPLPVEQERWIPVTERPPKEYTHVLCQFTLGGMAECYWAHGVFHIVGGVLTAYNDVIAWRPLPEPYVYKADISQSKYYRFSDGWFDYFVNVVTGEKKYKLEDGDIEI